MVGARTGKYGAVGVAKVECWVTGSHDPLRLLFYIPVCFGLAYAIYVLMYVHAGHRAHTTLPADTSIAIYPGQRRLDGVRGI